MFQNTSVIDTGVVTGARGSSGTVVQEKDVLKLIQQTEISSLWKEGLPVHTLYRKLFRTIRTNLGQFLGLTAIVMAGVVIYVSMSTVYMNLTSSEQQFYADYNFADYYFVVVKAPATVTKKIESVNGVAEAAGRVQKDLTLLRADGQRGVVRITGFALPLDQGINRLMLQKGRAFDPNSNGNATEALVDPAFYTALQGQNLEEINVLSEGRQVPIKIIGFGTSPEFIYPMQDANNPFPKPGLFGIVMMEQNQAQQLLNMPGQVNQFLVNLEPGADEAEVAAEIEAMLKPYGFLTSFAKKDQLSNFVVDAKIEGVATMATVLPIVFFLVAAGVQFIIIVRVIRSQRLQIGIMKALGYSSGAIMAHYCGYAVLVSVTGTIAGSLLGTSLATWISRIFGQYFNLPAIMSGLNIDAIFKSLLICTSVGLLSGLMASYRVTRIIPAEAMRPEPPRIVGKATLEAWPWLWGKFDSLMRMSIRSMSRNRTRTAVTVLGVATSVMVLILGYVSNDAMRYIMDRQYNQENLYNYIVHFSRPIKSGDYAYWRRWDEVESLEYRLEMPVAFWKKGQENQPGAKAEDDLLIGMPVDSQLKTVLDADDRPLGIPDDGIIISEQLSQNLGVTTGDVVQGETRLGIGPARPFQLKVMGVNTQYLSMACYASIETANRLLQEEGVSNAALLRVSAGQDERFEQRLRDMSAVNAVISKEKERDNVTQLMANVVYMIGIMILFAMVLGVTIAFNAVTISFTERRRELASMLAMGFSRREVGRMLFNDMLVQSLAGIIIGLPLGRMMAGAYIQSVKSDLFTLPIVIYPQTYVTSAVLVLVFVLCGFLLSIRRLQDIDMVESLKGLE